VNPVAIIRKGFPFGVLLAGLLLLGFGCQHKPKVAYGDFPGAENGTRAPSGAQDNLMWNEYGGPRTMNTMGEKFSPLDKINKANVGRLKKLWVWNTGEKFTEGPKAHDPKSLEVTPVYFDGKLFGCSIYNKVFALDPDTGKMIWEANPKVRRSDKVWAYKCRGVAIWYDPKMEGQACAARVFTNTIDGRVLALDAKDGLKPCKDFTDHIDGQPVVGGKPGEVTAWVNVMSPYPDLNDRLKYIRQPQPEDGETAPTHPWRDEFYMTSSPLVYKDLVIVGGGIADNGRFDATAGALQAFNARTGELMWTWDPAPKSFTDHADPQKQPLAYGTPNVWAPMAADNSRGLIFVPTGAAAPDYYGAKRDGKDQYANSIVALRVEKDGRLLDKPVVEWQFKAVIQDKWDFDMPAQPVLTDLMVNGKSVPVVMQATKMGFVYIMDRNTGQPLFPTTRGIVDRKTGRTLHPATNGIFRGKYEDLLQEVSVNEVVPEEKIIEHKSDFLTETADGKAMFEHKTDGSHSKFQPFPPPEWQLHGTPQTKKGLMSFAATLSPLIKTKCEKLAEAYNYEGDFTPPSVKGGINFPGAVGGVDWAGVTVDPVNQLLYVNQVRVATIAKMYPRADYDKLLAEHGHDGPKAFKEAYFDMAGTPYGLHRFPFINEKNLPCTAPPFGVLKAISLRDGSVKWEQPFGDFVGMVKVVKEIEKEKANQAAKAQMGEMAVGADQKSVKDYLAGLTGFITKGITKGYIKATLGTPGVPNFGGSLVTKGGLLFIGAAADGRFRVLDSSTGEVLKTIDLAQFNGAGSGAATPMTFISPQGRQIVVIASGGNKFIPGRQGDAIVAFAVE
jgi:quinoprotein glucose dehydrogenase